ncbi:fec operon regulator FecR [mine drainage metagenome]|uniref:Fec operon regulator FecR n=1 Tax=mine drainage metagenome TaxID=410659 RepID=A0A1J5S5N7_9ZZZZ
MDYKLYEIEDFVSDESYLRYYFKLNNNDVDFWQDWISTHPEKLDIIICADNLISILFLQLPEEEFQKECERIRESVKLINDYPKGSNAKTPKISFLFRQYRFPLLAAASVLFIMLTGIFYFLYHSKNNDTAIAIEILGKDKTSNENDSKFPQKLRLEDGTVVTLQPGARLIYPPHFLKNKREVYLTGEAFFVVSKNAQRPFYVYYNNIVTHVLGTSFNVKIDKKKREVEVSVRTGRVEVSERVSEPHDVRCHVKNKGVVLTPNQKVIYKEETKNFESGIVDDPLPVNLHEASASQQHILSKAVDNENLIVEEVPLSEIIKSLENTYQITIEVDDDKINNYHFSGDISNMNLFAKLNTICKAVGIGYEIKGTKILMSSHKG